MITLVPEGGLCNRMRAVASAAALAERQDRPLRVVWYATPDLNSRFADLFEVGSPPFEVVERSALGMLKLYTKAFCAVQERILPLVGRAVTRPLEAQRFLDHPAELKSAQAAGRWHIRTHSKLVDGPNTMFAALRPVESLRAVVESYRPMLPEAVGVHVRRSDNAKSIEHSPLAGFVRHMREYQHASKSVKFFVATDSHSTLETLRNEFGDAVFSHPKPSLRRDDPQAIRDAVVDLYVLSQCRSMIGSYWSSFTDTAAELSGIPCEIVNEP